MLLCSVSIANQRTEVIFINNNSFTTLGIVKFIVDDDNKPVDYEDMDITWTDKKKTLQLEHGLYGITQYRPVQKIKINNKIFLMPDKIINYKSFWVKENIITIIF